MAAVQALPRAPAVYASPVTSIISLSTPMTVPWGAGALHQRLNAFVKKSLIKQLVPTGAVVCDFYCGRGVDTDNWAEAQIGKYVGIDLSSSALEEAKEQWEKNGKRFAAKFCELNPCMVDLERNLGEDGLSADVVTCLAHLQDCFAAEDMVRQLLKNVASLLKPGGYFFGATPDSSTIWYKYQKAVEGAMKAGSLRANGHLPRVRTDLYSISFEDDRFNQYGSRYQLRFTDDTVPPQPQILVHFPSLIRHAEEFGLEYVEIQNLTEFYEDYRVPFAETLQNSCGTLVDSKGNPVVDGKSRLSPIAQDVLSLYTTFIFKKPDPQQRLRALKRPAPPAPTPGSSDVKRMKKSSPASLVQVAAAEETPLKKRRISGPNALPSSNGSRLQEPIPKQEKRSSSGSRSKLEVISKNELDRSSGKILKTPDGESKLVYSQPNLSESKLQERLFKPEIASSESRDQLKSVEKLLKPESLSASKSNAPGSQKTEVSSASEPNASEGQRIDGTNLRVQELKAEFFQSKKSIIQGSSEPELESPSSSGLPPEAHLTTESVEREKLDNEQRGSDSNQRLEPMKRKRVSRWSSDYVPKVVASTGEQMTERKDQGVALQQPGQGALANFPLEHQLVTGPICPKVGVPAGIEGGVAQNSNSLVCGAKVASGGPWVRKQHLSEKGTTNVSDVKSQHDERYNHKDLNIPLKGFYQRSPWGSQEYGNERGSIQRREHENNSSESVLAERGVECIEEGEVITGLPVRKTSSPNRDKPAAIELHYERRAAQRSQRSGTVSGSTYRREMAASDPQSERNASGNPENIGSETWLEGDAVQNDSKARPAIQSKYTANEPKSKIGVASIIDAQLQEGSKQEISSITLEPESNINDQKKRKVVEPLLDEAMNEQKRMGASSSSQENPPAHLEAKKENLNPKPRKKEIVMDVLMDRTTNQSRDCAASCATQSLGNTDTDLSSEKSSMKKRESPSVESVFGRGSGQNKDSAVADADFEKGSKSSRDSFTVEHQSEIGSTQKRENGGSAEPFTSDIGKNPSKEIVETDSQSPKSQGFKRDNFELPWEAKPQRYPALRRATPQMSEGAVENPPLWHRGNFVVKVDRTSQGRGPVIYPRNPYANSGPGFVAAPRPPLRATAERRVVVPPLQGGAGLLGAAPSPSFVDRGLVDRGLADRGLPADRRFDMMGPPEGGRGYNDHRGPRPIRGSLYKDRVAGVSRVQPDFAGEGNNCLGGSWDDHFQGDGRTRNR
ncbi:uncharacterized protein [Physcomitrium patens]|nr:serine/arginine repetitive matrix protein 2-like isoform X1 [Physcomitrium patens]|eukprot:XP_024389594.1 serine/arginine repetitive matrix protein 2-like isoform X1 [Physcomitrella patens]